MAGRRNLSRYFIAPAMVGLLVSGCASSRPSKAVVASKPAMPTSASTLPSTTTTSAAPATTVVVTTTIARVGHQTSPTTLGCVMSHDPACGPMWFDPPPAPDQPVHIVVTASPAHPTAGQTVTFHVVMDDPDGPIGCIQSVSDGQTSSVSDCGLSLPCDRFGAWSPPMPAPGHAQQDISATYRRPGQYTFTIAVVPNSSSCTDSRTHRGEQPYVSAGSGSLTITVA
jgi:hypothetical protein